YRHTIESVYF
ncbi:CPXV054 protein, partial [Monkeypox virus]